MDTLSHTIYLKSTLLTAAILILPCVLVRQTEQTEPSCNHHPVFRSRPSIIITPLRLFIQGCLFLALPTSDLTLSCDPFCHSHLPVIPFPHSDISTMYAFRFELWICFNVCCIHSFFPPLSSSFGHGEFFVRVYVLGALVCVGTIMRWFELRNEPCAIPASPETPKSLL